MKTILLFSSALYASLTIAQNTLPSTLPTCAQQCTVLTGAQQSCASNQAVYQSCFCSSSLLGQLLSPQPVQLCSQCSATDMQTIQNWYKGTCQNNAVPGANNQPSISPSSTTTPPTISPTASVVPKPGSTLTTNSQDANGAQAAPSGPWMSTHYKWVIMLIVLVIGLAAAAFIFWFLHRRYHRRREAQWGQAASGSMPNISTWGPGQSVHDLGLTPGAGANVEKGKGREQTRGVNEPPPARMRENRLSKF